MNRFRVLCLKKNYILALEMASPWNQHCASCIGTRSFPIVRRCLPGSIFSLSAEHQFVTDT